MLEYVSLLILAACIAVFAIRGATKGLPAMVAGILALACGYAGSYTFVPKLVGILTGNGVNALVAVMVSMPVVFFVSYFLVSYGVSTLFRFFQIEVNRFYGMLLGCGIGLAVGLVGVWMVGLIPNEGGSNGEVPVKTVSADDHLSMKAYRDTLLSRNQERRDQEQAQLAQDNDGIDGAGVVNGEDNSKVQNLTDAGGLLKKADYVVKQAANKIMANVVEASVSSVGDVGPQGQKLVRSFVEKPTEFVSSFEGLAKSGEIAEVWNSPETQYLMATDNYAALAENENFKQMLATPAFQQLLTFAEPDKEQVSPDELKLTQNQLVAKRMGEAWQRITYYKNEPKVQAILGQENLQKMLQGGNPVELLTNGDFRELMSVFLEPVPEGVDIDYSQYVDTSGLSAAQLNEFYGQALLIKKPIKPLRENVEMFRWQDSEGNTYYTEEEDIPVSLRPTAVKVGFQK